jgi:glycosyltransferase involved in cell wall biosynthesis
LISYHFGPRAATGGFRWTRLAHLLAVRGWQFDVLTHDEVLAGELPETIRVHRVRIPAVSRAVAWLPGEAPGALLRLLRRRGRDLGNSHSAPPARAVTPATVVPADPRRVKVPLHGQAPPLRTRLVRALDGLAEETRILGWARAAATRSAALAAETRYDAAVVSSPPHATLSAGLRLRARTGIPFIADFRDPWVLGLGESLANMSAAHRWLGERIEPRVNREAAAVVHNTDIERRVIGALMPGQISRHHYIPNGHDLTHVPGYPRRDQFVVTYTGHMHPWMDPRPFFAACQRFLAGNETARRTIRIVFMGTPREFGGVDLRALAAAYGLSDCFDLRPRGTREEANALQESAAVLLAYDCTHPMCVPAKFFDYAYMRGAMLLIGHPDGAMAEMAAPLGLQVVARDDADGLDAALSVAFVRWREGELTEQNDRGSIYARQKQAEQWDALLQDVARDASR